MDILYSFLLTTKFPAPGRSAMSQDEHLEIERQELEAWQEDMRFNRKETVS